MPTVAAGGELITSVAPALMVMLSGPLTVLLLLSVAFTVRFAVPAVVGVPLIVQPVIVSPAGRVPAVNTQLYGETPPETPMVELYANPTVPFGREVVVRVSGAGFTTMLIGVDVVRKGLDESVALTVTVKVPGVVGVPLKVHPVRVNPAGSVPAVTPQL